MVEWLESGDHPGPRTVAWLVAHLTDVFTERYDWTVGEHEARRETLTCSGEVGPAVDGLTRVVDLWRAGIAEMSDDDIFTVGLSQATAIDQQSPFAHLVAHINRELIHHGSEISTLTDLYRVRGGTPMSDDHVARATVDIPAPAETVWDTLVDPEGTWMLGARVTSTYIVGVPITFQGEWDGKPFEDHGEILEVDRPRRLRYSHWSPLSGQPDDPENYHHLTFTFEERDGSTEVTLEQDGNGSAEEAAHTTATWEQVLGALRDAVAPDAGTASST